MIGATRSFIGHLILASIVLFCLSTLGSAQSYRGSIRGKVVDPHHAVIAGAKISAKNVATGQVRETATGEDGGYVLAELPAGNYVVTADATGLTPAAQNVIVNVGLDTTADFDLATVQQRKEEVTVTTSAPLVDDTRDVLGEVVDQRLVSDLPLNGRDFGKLVALVPGASVEPSGVAAIQSGFGQFSINGSRDRSNNYTLDGTDNNDPFFNNSAFNQTGIGGAPASVLPIDAIQELTCNRSSMPSMAATAVRLSTSSANPVLITSTDQRLSSCATTCSTPATFSIAASILPEITSPKASSEITSSAHPLAALSSRRRLFSSAPMRGSASG